MVGQDGLTIGQVSDLLGVPVPTLRSWHLRYGVATPERTGGGHRRYRDDEVSLLQALSAAVAHGIAPRSAAQAPSSVRTTGAQAVVVTAHQVSRRRHAVEALQALAGQRVRLFYAGAAFSTASRRRDVPGTHLGDVLLAAADLVERQLAAH